MHRPSLAANTVFRVRFRHSPISGFVSVVIPVYKDVPGLRDTLTSLTRQTLPTSRYEIIVCNDGADSEVSDTCRHYRVQEVRISPNRGSYHARNRGLEEARGEFIAFVDADITVPERWLEVGLAALQQADYVGGPVFVDEGRARTPADYHEVRTGFRGNRPAQGHGFFVTANLFVARRVFERMGGFDQRLRSGGDNEFGNRVLSTNEFKHAFSDELAVLHPPRGYRKLVGKRVRVAFGKEVLSHLYPKRYAYRRPSTSRLLLNVVLPPSPSRVAEFRRENPQCGLIASFVFLWRFKADVSLRLLPIARRASREAERLLAGDDTRSAQA